MTFADRVRENIAKLAAVAGIPAGIVQAEAAFGIDNTTPLGPGTPIAPENGFSTVPRAFDYRAGYNIAGKPRINMGISFPTMRAVIDAYDVAQICITHRIDSIRSYEWVVTPAPGITDDMTDAIKLALRVLNRLDPSDPDLRFKGWLSKYLWDVLAFDAGTLYRVRNRIGQPIGLRVVDGTTIAPLLDAWGNKPGYDFESQTWAPAYIQYVQGMTWDWLTVRDLIYSPFRPISNTPYGRAPIETILLNANTDLRFQTYFLQRFTAGNIPEGFAISPEDWTPDQIEQWEAKWNAFLLGDQEILSQIKWVPGGTKFEWSNEHEFTSDFSEFLMRKTCAAFHVSPNEIGFTEDVNRSTGETQIGVQERVGDMPLMQHVEGILTGFLQDDLQLPLEFHFKTGNDDLDNLALAQSDKVYIDSGVISPSDIAELRFGKVDAEEARVPRYILTGQGPMPLSTLMQLSAPIAPDTEAPAVGAVVPGSLDSSLQIPGVEVQKALEAPKPVEPTAAERAELGQFAKFVKARKRDGSWRPFTFEHVPALLAHRLNAQGYAEIRKAAGELSVAGLVVLAADTGRVLMLQRALDDTDPNGGRWEFPGGHIEPGESPFDAACREWCEEVAMPSIAGVQAAEWLSPNGRYGGFVIVVPDESVCAPRTALGGTVNPDDPDGDAIEAVAWWEPAQLVGNPAVRPELAADLSLVLGALHDAEHAAIVKDAALVDYVRDNGIEALADLPAMPQQAMLDTVRSTYEALRARHAHDLGESDADPFVKAAWRDSSAHAPQHRFDVVITDAYTDDLQRALLGLLDRFDIGELVERAGPLADGLIVKAVDAGARDALIAQIRSWLALPDGDLTDLHDLLNRLFTDGFTTGLHAAGEQLAAHHVTVTPDLQPSIDVSWEKWKPGDSIAIGEVAAGALRQNLDSLGITVKGIANTVLDSIGNKIGDGLLAGDGIDKIARSIREEVGSKSRALRIAHTETARAQTNASMLVYADMGVTEYDVLISDGACSICIAAHENGPYPLDDPAGLVPFHPFCRCANAPRAESIDANRIVTRDYDPDESPLL